MAAYSAALANTPRPEIAATRTRAGSVSAMVAGYLGSAAFHNLAPISQQQYRRIFDGLRREHGDRSIATLERRHVIRILDTRLAPRRPRATSYAACGCSPSTRSASACAK